MLKRREFLKAAGTVAVVGGLAPAITRAAAPEPPAGALPTRTLGKTGWRLPILGFGGAALPQAWLNPLSYDDRVALVRYAFDRGVRYFDTAGNYLESQAILGEALKDWRRQVCLVSKVEATKPEDVRKAVERALTELRTDYLDGLLIHGTPGIQQMTVARAMEIHGAMKRLQDEKMIRFIGLSAHGYFDKALALISTGGFELGMLSYGYIPRGHDQAWTARTTALRDACLAKAHELGMGIVAMKVIGAGMLGSWSGHIVPDFDKARLVQLPAAAIRHVAQDPRVHMLVIGMRLKKDVDDNVNVLARDTTYTPADRLLLADFSAKLRTTAAFKKLKVE